MVVPQIEDRAIELARKAQGIPVGALFHLHLLRPGDGDGRDALLFVDLDPHDAVFAERRELDARAARAIG